MECRVHRLLFFWCVLAALEPTLAAASKYPRLLLPCYCTNYSELKLYKFEIRM